MPNRVPIESVGPKFSPVVDGNELTLMTVFSMVEEVDWLRSSCQFHAESAPLPSCGKSEKFTLPAAAGGY